MPNADRQQFFWQANYLKSPFHASSNVSKKKGVDKRLQPFQLTIFSDFIITDITLKNIDLI